MVTHTLIIWEKGLHEKDFIINDLKENFQNVRLYNFKWDKKHFHENLRRFYSHSQFRRKERKFDKIIKGKIKHCGDGEFLLIIFDDVNPNFQERLTSSGKSTVNANVFEKKAAYRKLTGGGHKIHSSDDAFETNKDLCLLLGVTTAQYIIDRESETNETLTKTNNITGVPAWKNVEQLFFILNNAIDYVVLRNFECLPESYTVKGHGDIDLLVENLNYIKYLTGAVNVYPKKKNRCYHHININNEDVPFDFRHIADNYYDVNWERDILKTKTLEKDCFYIPNQEHLFHSLLYHGIIHKPVFGNDYKEKLERLSNDMNSVSFTAKDTIANQLGILSNFLKQHHYNLVKPIDKSVFFNSSLFCLNEYSEINYFRNKQLISIATPEANNTIFPTEVYKNNGSYLKRAQNPVCENENVFITRLNNTNLFPEVLKFNTIGNTSEIYLKEVTGFQFSKIHKQIKFWKKKNIVTFIQNSIDILISLTENDIMHRDIRPDNLILTKKHRKYHPILIDFGWAVDLTSEEAITPKNLGHKFRYKENQFSDSYSFSKSVKRKIKFFSYTKKFQKQLSKITPESYQNKEDLLKTLNELKSTYSNKKFTFFDYIALNTNRVICLITSIF